MPSIIDSGLRRIRRASAGRSDGPGPFDPDRYGTKDEDERKPIGVPSGYTTPVQRTGTYSPVGGQTAATMGRLPGTIKEQGPRYFDEHIFVPAALDPASIGRLQADLNRAGLLTNFRYGVWDQNSQDAYKILLGNANAAGVTHQTMLAQMIQSPQVDVGGGGSGSGGSGGRSIIGFDENGNPIFSEFTPPPLEVRTTNKDDLRRAFRTAIIDTLGEGWSQAQINEMVDAYNWKEIEVQKSAYDQEVERMRAEFMGEQPSTEPISVVSPPSPDTFLENELRERDPEGFQAGQMVNDFVPQFMQMMGGWV